MKYRLRTLFLLLSLLAAASANTAWACGGSGGDSEQSEKSCCTDGNEAQNAHCGSGADGCNEQHPGQPCSDGDGCGGGCHCPGCGTTSGGHAGGFLAELPIFLCSHMASGSVQRQAFYFADHMPEAVYLPIWQPPQLSA